MSRASRNKLPRLTKGRRRQAARQDARKAREASKLAAKPEKAAQKARDPRRTGYRIDRA